MSEVGTKTTAAALKKLLKRAENAWIAGASGRDCTLVFSAASFPEYLRLPQRADQDTVHAQLRTLEHQGILSIDWDPRAGKHNQITRIRLIDPEKLAVAADVTPHWKLYHAAYEALNPWHERYNIPIILERWKTGKTVRGYGPKDVMVFVDGCRVLDGCAALPADADVLVRRFSASLFADSKRIEDVYGALDALTIDTLDSPARSPEEVLEPLGLLKLPQPVLLSGLASLILNDGSEVRLPSPYLGVSPQAITAVQLGQGCRYVLSVENLTTFHELALGKAGRIEGLIVYTAGMPSPSMLYMYRRVIAAAGDIPIWHWGDIDLGGFRIASVLANQINRPLRLWSMSGTIQAEVTERKRLSDEERLEIQRICGRHGWTDIAAEVLAFGKAIEQESLPLSLP